MLQTKVLIVGAGPAGATLSHFLEKEKIDHLLVDKAAFPRDKICGDGITVDVLNVLKRISPDFLRKFDEQSEMLPSWGFCFHAANGRELRYDFKDDGFPYAPFYTSTRLDLDKFLIEELPQNHGRLKSECEVKAIDRKDSGFITKLVHADAREEEVYSDFVIGAEGEKPVVTRHLGLAHYRAKEHLIAALRVYYKDVKGFHPHNHLEFFFDKSLLPGYFWAFPLAGNRANVGLGMVSTAISAKKVNLKKQLNQLIAENEKIAGMFENAEALETPKGWGLPIITPKRKIAGAGYALIGDAAGMIEPFTGKGIGPGMMSARICSEHIAEAISAKQTDLSCYGEHMYRYYKSEIRSGYALQKSLKYPTALNAVIGMSNLSALKKWSHNKMSSEWDKWMR